MASPNVKPGAMTGDAYVYVEGHKVGEIVTVNGVSYLLTKSLKNKQGQEFFLANRVKK